MIRQSRQAAWPLDDRMNVVLFAGMGGGCDGLEAAGYPVHLAINHDRVAVAVHERRHPHTRHLRCDVFEVDPRQACKGQRVGVLHGSPDCTHFSVAKGSKPVSKRRRSLAWVMCRWAGTVRPELITLENVREITTWGPLIAKRDKATGRVLKLDGTIAGKGERVPVEQQWLVPNPRHKGRIWRSFVRHLREHLGYSFEWRISCFADEGVPTIRTRLVGCAHADGRAVVWPERTHAPRHKAKALGLKPWVGAHTIIDWSLPAKSIFGRKKELAPATLRRTARGVMRYVVNAAKPFIVPITHVGGDRVHSTDDPLRTLTTAHRGELAVVAAHLAKFNQNGSGTFPDDPLGAVMAGAPRHAVVAASLIQSGYGEREGQAPRVLDIGEPATTQVAGGSKAALVAAFLAQHNTGEPGRSANDPVSTIVTLGSTQGIVAASLAEMRGASKSGRDILEPAAAITAGGGHAQLILAFLQHYFGSGKQDDDVKAPLGALTGKARYGLVEVKVGRELRYIDDIGMRMLEPEEGARAHGFPDGALPDVITIDGVSRRLTKTEKYHLVGNSVPPWPIERLVRANARPAMMVAAE